MHANKFELIFNGFDILKKNRNLLDPFFSGALVGFIGFIVLGVLALLIAILFYFGFGSTSAELFSSIMYIYAILCIFFCFLLFCYFLAGAIGMAKEVIESGKTNINTMWATGKACYVKMIVTNIFVLLIYAAIFAIIFVLTTLIEIKGTAGLMVIFISLLALVILYLGLALVPYAVVIDNLAGGDAIERGLSFFMKNKYDVLFISVVSLFMDLIISLIGDVFSSLGQIGPLLSGIWALIGYAFSFTITIIWWTMLYTDKHPNLTSEV
jgi:hypothetical protein